jgi:hypothetical protein
LFGIKHILLDGLRVCKPQYLVVWQNSFGMQVSFNITTVLALLKSLISPTYANFWKLLKSCDIVLSIEVLTRLQVLPTQV